VQFLFWSPKFQTSSNRRIILTLENTSAKACLAILFPGYSYKAGRAYCNNPLYVCCSYRILSFSTACLVEQTNIRITEIYTVSTFRAQYCVKNWLLKGDQDWSWERTDMECLRNEKWSFFLETLHPQSSQLWKITRYFKQSPATVPPLTHISTQVIYTPYKVEILARQFEQSSPHNTYGIAQPFTDDSTSRQ
jgi:hypothetical protein